MPNGSSVSRSRLRRVHLSQRGNIEYDLMFSAVPSALKIAILLEFGSVVRAHRHFTFVEHQHKDHELVLVEAGKYRCRVNHHPLVVLPKQALLIGPGDFHEDNLSPGVRYRTVSFSLLGGDVTRLLRANAAPALQRMEDQSGNLMRLAKELGEEWHRDDWASPLLEQALSQALVWHVIRCLPLEVLHPNLLSDLDEDPLSRRLRQLFTRSLGTSLDVATMARELGMSPSRLNSKCRASLGVSPTKAFNAYRLACAQELLTETSLSVKEIAAKLGYANAFVFTRAFKQHFGRPPSHCRPPSPEAIGMDR